MQGNTTRMIIQSGRPLIPGRDVYAGADELAVNVGVLLSKSGGAHYYAGSVPGKAKVRAGDVIVFESKRRLSLPQVVSMSLDQRAVFSQKFTAEVTAVQGDRAMIDKGTLQEVHERDLYEVFDSSGRYKGLLEIRGIGDFQSSGKLYNRWEDRSRRALQAQPGDRVKFVGQRMQFGFGIAGGLPFARTRLQHNFDSGGGGGVLWNVTLPTGWGVEMLLGMYQRRGYGATALPSWETPTFSVTQVRNIRYVAPIWLKKNLFYPSKISPFVAAGVSWYSGLHKYEIYETAAAKTRTQIKTSQGLTPVVGAGIEFLPTRLFRPRVDVRHFFSPKLEALGNVYRTETTFYSVAIMTAW